MLARNEYVIVPHLGGFVLQSDHAHLENDCLVAPRSVLAFNALMQHNDGLLVIEIARSEGISYREAQQELEQKMTKFKQKLAEQHLLNASGLSFGNFGAFRLNAHNTLTFQPQVDANFIPNNIGMENIWLRPLENEIQLTIKPASKSFFGTKLMRYAAVITLAVTIQTLSFEVNDTARNQDASLFQLNYKATLPESIPTDSVLQKSISKAGINSDSSSIATATTRNEYSFHVVVASMPNQKSANWYYRAILAKEFPDAHILEPTKTFRIAIKSFDDKQQAIAFMENLRKTDARFENAWVLCK
ncbi:MAG: hypothetical protein AUK44_09925 [Porphyromonadaceae bacterium CG2_30_38_12]|nr:MAG: hypothetical protein AUK44_09925 [Porphyromonadaceae bacterium CG2_30_38_12]